MKRNKQFRKRTKLTVNKAKHKLALYNKCHDWYSVIKDISYYDYGFCFEIEYHFLEKLRDSIKKANMFVGTKVQVQHIETTLRILKMIMDYDDGVEYDFNTDKFVVVKYTNTRNVARYDSHLAELFDNDPLLIGETRLEKLFHLYHKARIYWMRKWWW